MFGFRRDAQARATLSGRLISDLLAEAGVTSPAYLYDLDAIGEEARSLVNALRPGKDVVAYAVKANSAGSIVRKLVGAGTGADVVSGAELRLALSCGVAPSQLVMSGVAKTDAELDAAIGAGILSIQVESVEEVARVAARARAQGRKASISFRLNPNVAIESHRHISTGHDKAKFGVALADMPRAWEAADSARDALDVVGISTHVGSMLTSPSPYLESAAAVCEVARARLAAGGSLRFVDFGGGYGIDYGGRPVRPPAEYAAAALGLLKERGLDQLGLVVEPGRSLVGAHGVLVARVVQSKVSGELRWVMIDAGMNDLIRPALYSAVHRIEPLSSEPAEPSYRVVGPVCESSDDFGSHPLGATPPDWVVIRDAGAYGFTMASEYNGRALPSEVFVEGGRVAKVSRSPGAEAWVERRLGA